MNIPQELKYTKDHEWISIDGNVATIGVTDFAQRELGDIVFVDISAIGKELNAGDVFGTVEAVKTVSEVNSGLESAPEKVNTDPYGEGWMVKMTIKNEADIASLLDAAAYGGMVA
jgi:glycine cleavage system H protein